MIGTSTLSRRMAYSGKWNSTDQVPERAIAEGIIDRFGSLNPTDGGVSSRESLSFSRVKRNRRRIRCNSPPTSIRYKLDLWSTFTYYLRDPLNGDQMLQHDDRVVYGFKGSNTWHAEFFGLPMSNVIGVQARIDDIRDVGIFSTVRRRTIGTDAKRKRHRIEWGGVCGEQRCSGPTRYAPRWVFARIGSISTSKTRCVNADGSCNIDSDPEGCVTGDKKAGIFSPKLGISFGPVGNDHDLSSTPAMGYHSNDARGVTRSGENPGRQPP